MSHSNPAKRSRLDILLENQQRRQKILDWLRQQGQQRIEAISLMLGLDRRIVSTTLCDMRQRGELAVTGSPKKFRWVALVSTTISAEAMLDNISSNRVKAIEHKKSGKPPEPDAPAGWINGRLVHKGGKNKASEAGSGGQGALRPRVYVNCYTPY